MMDSSRKPSYETQSSGAGRYQCTQCQRTYTRVDHLARHVRSRMNPRPSSSLPSNCLMLTLTSRPSGTALPVPDVPEMFRESVSRSPTAVSSLSMLTSCPGISSSDICSCTEKTGATEREQGSLVRTTRGRAESRRPVKPVPLQKSGVTMTSRACDAGSFRFGVNSLAHLKRPGQRLKVRQQGKVSAVERYSFPIPRSIS